ATLAFFAPRCILLQCGSERFPPVTVALLGRFLPRLGPLQQCERPFFFAAADEAAPARFTRPRRDRAAALPAEFRRAGRPGWQARPPAGRTRPSVRSAARPCKAHG